MRYEEAAAMMAHRTVEILYTSWKGEKTWRLVRPHLLERDTSGYHDGGWTVRAYDVRKKATRAFALDGIHAWWPFEVYGDAANIQVQEAVA